jgi:hypothetical protein
MHAQAEHFLLVAFFVRNHSSATDAVAYCNVCGE